MLYEIMLRTSTVEIGAAVQVRPRPFSPLAQPNAAAPATLCQSPCTRHTRHVSLLASLVPPSAFPCGAGPASLPVMSASRAPIHR